MGFARLGALAAALMSLLPAARGLAQAQPAAAKPASKPPAGQRQSAAPAPWKSVEIGNYYLRRKNYRAALSRFREAVTTDPEYAEGYLGLGRVYEKTGKRRKALAAYQKYLDLLPSDRDAENAKQVHRAMARLRKNSG
ncbi:MAG TPA: tetratricopeptide repeat protein [Terriglobia bacterium]|nr:tetratricopeptide repeat protein [Terriglobia bacterium]